MAVSVASVSSGVVGNRRMTVSNVTMDSSYLSGGETLAASALGLTVVDYAICTIKAVGGTINVASAAYEVKSDPSTNLLHLYDETPAEVASTSDVSSDVIQVVAYGH